MTFEWCPHCGGYGFSEYIDEPGHKKCLQCGYRERVVDVSDKARLKRLIKLHEKELLALEEEEKKGIVSFLASNSEICSHCEFRNSERFDSYIIENHCWCYGKGRKKSGELIH